MSRRDNQILHPAPVRTPLVKLAEDESVSVEEGDQHLLHSSWLRFFENLNSVVSNFFQVRTIQNMDGIAHIGVAAMTRLTTAQRDEVINWQDGDIIYNTTSNKFNFRENGSWKEIP